MHSFFSYFSSFLSHLQVTTADGFPLPSWLHFDTSSNLFMGIPTQKNLGELPIKVVAKGDNTEDFVMFTIMIKDAPSLTSGSPLKFKRLLSPGAPEVVHCKHDEAETVATIVIDTDMEVTPVTKTVALLDKFLQHMELHHDMVRLVPVGNSPLQDSSALVSGPGDSTLQKTAGIFISWPVGCGQVKEGHFKILQRLDDDSRSGQMAKVVGFPIIGWHVSNSHLQPLKRKRRQVMVTATPSLTPTMSTKAPEKSEDAGEKMTREVPDRSSPVIVQPTVTIEPTATMPMMSKTAEVTATPMYSKPSPSTMVKPSEVPVVTTPAVTTKKLPTIVPSATVTEGEKSDDIVVVPPTTGGSYCLRDQSPTVKRAFKKLDFTVGEVIDFVIPADTFDDCEVGGTRGLKLKLHIFKTNSIPSDFFVQFDEKMQKIIGLPMAGDVGRFKMNLVAMKNAKVPVTSFPFNIVIKGTKNKKKINHELSVSIDHDYDQFMSSVKDKTMLAKKVASVFDDADASNLVITKLARGSVVFGWANKSMSSNNCPIGSIKGMVDKMVNEDGTLTDQAIDKLKPYYLSSAASAPAGSCEGHPDFPAVTSLPRKPDATVDPGIKDKTDSSTEESQKRTKAPVDPVTSKPKTDGEGTTEPVDSSKEGDDDTLITTVIPAIVIVVILIIALIIACILYRKKRKGKMNVEEQNTFVNKGAPVIFPDELEDKPSDVNKPLLVEGTPTPPPGYHRGNGESPDIEMTNHRNGLNYNANEDASAELLENKPYDPPPPLATSSNNKQPRPTQQPMSQHPHILP